MRMVIIVGIIDMVRWLKGKEFRLTASVIKKGCQENKPKTRQIKFILF